MLLLLYLLKVSACLGLFYGLYYFLFRRFTFHRLNRIYLLLTLGLSFMIPWVEIEQKRIVEVVPVAEEPVTSPQSEVFEQSTQSLGEESSRLINSELREVESIPEKKDWLAMLTWEQGSIGGYVMGLLVSLLALARRLWEIVRLSRKRQNASHKDWVEVSESFTAASFFGIIFMNSEALSDEEAQQVLLHEQTHARLFHSVDVLLIELCKVILWFNPVVYFYKKSLAEVHEYEVDEQLVSYVGAKTYAHLILKLATQSSHPLVHSFGKHPVTNRIHFLFQKPTSAMKKLLYAFGLPLGVAGVLAFAPRKEVLVYNEKSEAPKKVKEMPVKTYPLRVHNKHVWWYFKQQKMESIEAFGESNLTLNDLCMLESGGVYYVVNPNSMNLKDIAEVNRLIGNRWKVKVEVLEHSFDSNGKLDKISLAVKNLKTNQSTKPEVIDMVKARELGKQGGYLEISLRNPYWKPQVALIYGDKSLKISQCSKKAEEHEAGGVAGEMSMLKLSQDQIKYTVYPDKISIPTLQKVQKYFKEEGFELRIRNEKYTKEGKLASVMLDLYNENGGIAFYEVVLDDLRHFLSWNNDKGKKYRFDEALILEIDKITGEANIEIGPDWTEAMKKHGRLTPFAPQETAQKETLPDENSFEEFNKIVQEMRSKDMFFKRAEITSKADGPKEMLVFARGGEGTAATGLVVGMGKFPIYYLDGIKVQEDVVKWLKPSHIKKVDILEPEYNRYSAFVKKHKLEVKNEKIVWIERKAFDFKKVPAPKLDKKLSLRSGGPADTIRTFLPANELGENPLVFINGEEFPASVLTRVDPSKFGMTYIVKPNDSKAILKYGIRAVDGVVDIKTIDDCFFKTEQERMLAVENIRKILNTTNKRLSKRFLKNNEGNEVMMIVVRGFVYNEPFFSGFEKNARLIYMLDGRPVQEEEINRYEGKFYSAVSWKKSDRKSKFEEQYATLIEGYDGGIALKTTR